MSDYNFDVDGEEEIFSSGIAKFEDIFPLSDHSDGDSEDAKMSNDQADPFTDAEKAWFRAKEREQIANKREKALDMCREYEKRSANGEIHRRFHSDLFDVFNQYFIYIYRHTGDEVREFELEIVESDEHIADMGDEFSPEKIVEYIHQIDEIGRRLIHE